MSKKSKLVEARTLKGFQDLLPLTVAPRKRVIAVMESVFQRYGFMPLESPALEYLDVLLGTGGEETNKELFRLESPEQEPIALRFDHTVPFARLLAQYPDQLKVPVRRYVHGPVWRADKPGQWRFRQLYQVDIDVAGSNSVAVDAELVAIVCEIMAELGATGYKLILNDRRLIDALLEGCGITEEARVKHVLRVVDKLAKAGEDNVRRELGPGRIDDSGDPIPGVQLDDATISRIMDFIAVSGGNRADVVERVEAALPASDASASAVAGMRELNDCLGALGVPETYAVFQPSLARGLDYYTGPVFEVTVPGAEHIGSVGGGGRYDGLVSRFLNRNVPCTGMAFGLDRLMAALGEMGVLPAPEPPAQVLVVTMGKVPRSETLRVAAELRQAGFRTEAYFATKKKSGMKDQLSHADRHGIPVAVILGEDEVANGQVAVKDLLLGKREREDIEDHDAYREAGRTGQVTVARPEMAATVREILELGR